MSANPALVNHTGWNKGQVKSCLWNIHVRFWPRWKSTLRPSETKRRRYLARMQLSISVLDSRQFRVGCVIQNKWHWDRCFSEYFSFTSLLLNQSSIIIHPSITDTRGVHITGAGSHAVLNLVRWHLKFVDTLYSSCFMPHLWRLEFWGCSQICEKSVDPWPTLYTLTNWHTL